MAGWDIIYIAHQLRGAAGLRLRDHETGDEADGEVDGAEGQHEAGHAAKQLLIREVAARLVDRQVLRVQDGSLDLLKVGREGKG